jgi:hypothetical protein
MEQMARLFLYFFATALCFAQSPADLFEKAPPAVDSALRERIGQFYQLHIDGKFRQAEALVAEDTKDFFYSSNKPKYLSCEIAEIKYTDNFTNANAKVTCEMFVMMPGFTDKPLKVPHASRWKLVEGQWYWYVDMQEVNRTPFGEMKPGPGRQTGAAPAPAIIRDPAELLNQVKADKSDVTLSPVKGSEETVRIANRMPGPIKLEVSGTTPAGVEVIVETAEVPSNGVGSVTFRVSNPKELPKTAAVVEISANPLNLRFPVRVNIAASK